MRVLLLLGLVIACSRPPAAAPRVDATPAWTTLQSFAGTWAGVTDTGARVEITFRSISNGSALVETFGRPGRETMTLYHPDHRGLVATHYCGQGNAARLRVATVEGPRLVFAQTDVTDLDPQEASLVEMELTLGTDTFDRVEVYRAADGTLERTRWRFTRTVSDAGSGSAPG